MKKKRSTYIEGVFESLSIEAECLEKFNYLLKSLDVSQFILCGILNISNNSIIKEVKNTYIDSGISKSILRIRDNEIKRTFNVMIFDSIYSDEIKKVVKSKKKNLYKVVGNYVDTLFSKNKSIDIYIILLNNVYYYFSRNKITDAGTVRRHITIDINNIDEMQAAAV